MSTTTIRLPDELKERVARIAEARGLTAHAYILRAIEEHTAEQEEQAAFEQVAQRRWKQFQRDGRYYTIEDMRAYVLARARGESVALPPERILPADDRARLRTRKR
jgi:predicted transcriptional regulator